jgi:hypothetical protein
MLSSLRNWDLKAFFIRLVQSFYFMSVVIGRVKHNCRDGQNPFGRHDIWLTQQRPSYFVNK